MNTGKGAPNRDEDSDATPGGREAEVTDLFEGVRCRLCFDDGIIEDEEGGVYRRCTSCNAYAEVYEL